MQIAKQCRLTEKLTLLKLFDGEELRAYPPNEFFELYKSLGRVSVITRIQPGNATELEREFIKLSHHVTSHMKQVRLTMINLAIFGIDG